MLYPANFRIFQITAMFGLIVSSFVLMVHLNGPHNSMALADASRVPTKKQAARPVTPTKIYCAQQTKGKLRVSLLGITKGVAFLESQQPVIDGGRRRGNNVIRWVRTAVLVERLGDDMVPLGGVSVEFRTPDGKKLVENIKHEISVDGKPTVVTGWGAGVAQLDHVVWPRARELFPTALPNVEKPDQSTVFLATESGRIRTTRTATLLFRIGKNADQREFVFENVPMP